MSLSLLICLLGFLHFDVWLFAFMDLDLWIPGELPNASLSLSCFYVIPPQFISFLILPLESADGFSSSLQEILLGDFDENIFDSVQLNLPNYKFCLPKKTKCY